VNSQEQAPDVFVRDNRFGIHATRDSLMDLVFDGERKIVLDLVADYEKLAGLKAV
jgi:hypothetical protein